MTEPQQPPSPEPPSQQPSYVPPQPYPARPQPGPPLVREPQDAVARLERQVRSLRALAFGGLALGLVAVGLSAFSLARTPQAGIAGTAVVSPAAVQPATTTVQAAPAASTPAQTIGKPADAGAAPSGTIVLGAAGQGFPVLDIYEDFQCPACESVEQRLGPDVDQLVAGGKTEVRYHMMSFLDANLHNDSSVRAANGGFCAHEQGKFGVWHDTLFAPENRPPNEGDGWTDAQLAGFAGKSGLDVAAWTNCVASKKHAAQVTDANQLSLKSGVNATPTYKLNGTKLGLQGVVDAGGLVAFVDKYR